jgi:hypothetical protein
MSLDLNTIIGVASAIIATLSLIFAWQAVKVAERNNFAGIYTELHKLYMNPDTFDSIKVVWSIYDKYDDNSSGKEITHQEAYEIVKNMDRNSKEWQSIHNMSLFWKYIAILMKNGYINDEIAFNAFTSARMLGLLAPVEKAFLEYHYSNSNENNLPLLWLYQRWKKYISKNK